MSMPERLLILPAGDLVNLIALIDGEDIPLDAFISLPGQQAAQYVTDPASNCPQHIKDQVDSLKRGFRR